MIVAGILAIIVPPIAESPSPSLSVGSHFLAVSRIWYSGWHTRSTGGLLLEVLLGILYTVVGVYLLLNPVAVWCRSRSSRDLSFRQRNIGNSFGVAPAPVGGFRLVVHR